MSTVNQVMSALKKKGDPQQRRDLFKRHGAKDRLFGVSVADMKVITKIEGMGRAGKKRKTIRC